MWENKFVDTIFGLGKRLFLVLVLQWKVKEHKSDLNQPLGTDQKSSVSAEVMQICTIGLFASKTFATQCKTSVLIISEYRWNNYFSRIQRNESHLPKLSKEYRLEFRKPGILSSMSKGQSYLMSHHSLFMTHKKLTKTQMPS